MAHFVHFIIWRHNVISIESALFCRCYPVAFFALLARLCTCYPSLRCAENVQKCADPARKTKSHEIFRFTASTVDIPTRWNPRAKQQQRVALADFSAAPWQGFEKSERGPNNSSLFQPQAAVVVVALG